MLFIEDLPVLILAYNRVDKFTRCFKTLKDQGIKKFFVSIDGPCSKSDINNQEQIYKFCKNFESLIDIKINKLKKNYGCRLGPMKGINWFFSHNKYGLIMEDDVVVSKTCIESISLLLKKMEKNDNFISISSFNEHTNKNFESIYSLPVWRSWGWAGWAHKWEKYLQFRNKIKKLSIWGIYNLLPFDLRSIETAKLIKACQLNLLDAWDYEFNFYHIVSDKRSLTLGGINNYVYGFDESATHAIDINSLGIDFNLFKERHININQVEKLQKKFILSTLRKCGFSKFYTKNKFSLITDYLQYIFITFVFYIRRIKRNMFRRLKKT